VFTNIYIVTHNITCMYKSSVLSLQPFKLPPRNQLAVRNKTNRSVTSELSRTWPDGSTCQHWQQTFCLLQPGWKNARKHVFNSRNDSRHSMFDTGNMKIKDKIVLVLATKAYGWAKALLHSFSTSLLDGGECSFSRLGRFILVKGPFGIHWIGG